MLIMLINVCVIMILLTVEISTQTTFTWREAYDKCKRENAYLKTDITANEFGPSTRFNMSVWIGSIEFLSKWLEIRGCYRIDDHTTGNIYEVKTIANCEIECQGFEFFAYQTGEYPVCKCMSKLPTNTSNAKNCERNTYTHLIVYKRYSNSESYETKKENCMYMLCTPANPNNIIKGPYVVSCSSNNYNVHGVCANYEDIGNWRLGWNGSLQKCVSKYGIYFLDDFDSGCSHVTTNTWTRMFRKQRSFLYDIHSTKDVLNNHKLVKCAAKRWNVIDNSWNKEYIDCNSTLPFYFCKKEPVTNAPQASLSTVKAEKEQRTEIGRHSSKSYLRSTILSVWMTQAINQSNGVTNAILTAPGTIQNTDSSLINIGNKSAHEDKRLDSTTVESTYRTDEATHSNYVPGAIVGGSVGAVIVLLTGVTVILCKIRGVGVLKNKNSTISTNVAFTKSLSGEDTSLEVPTQQHVNQGYGLVYQGKEKNIKTNNAYAQVQKVKRIEDTYTESSNGEYDHLHNIDGRKPKAGENTYDSNAGVRNRNDPTYDTATISTRIDMDNTYDHSFTKLKTFSEYDVSDSRMDIARTNHDVYNQAC